MFLFLTCLLGVTSATLYTFGDVNITMSTISTGNIANTTSSNQCQKLIARSAQLYHVSSSSIYQSWPKGSLATVTDTQNVFPGFTVQDYDVNQIENQVIFGTNTLLNGRILYTLNATYHKSSSTSYNQANVIYQIDLDGSTIIVLYQNGTLNYVSKMDFLGNIIDSVSIPIGFNRLAVTPNKQKALVWNSTSYVKVLNLVTMNDEYTFVPITIPWINWMTEKITFSSDSSLALIEVGFINPITVFNINNWTNIK